jgi:serine/threonine protein kinase
MNTPPCSDMHEVDMELCLKNLRDEITSQNSVIRDVLEQMTTAEKNTDIFHRLSRQLTTNVKNISDILIQILEGLEFIHSNNEVHRDLKPENGPFPAINVLILVIFSYIHQRWKIADFGATSEATSKTLATTSKGWGTSIYRGPEIIQYSSFNTKSDIWAFGCIAFELFTKEKAFQGDWEVMGCAQSSTSSQKSSKEVFSGNWPSGEAAEVAKEISKSCVDNTLDFRWQKRPTATEILGKLRSLEVRSGEILYDTGL